jgi:hypothetical protein
VSVFSGPALNRAPRADPPPLFATNAGELDLTYGNGGIALSPLVTQHGEDRGYSVVALRD